MKTIGSPPEDTMRRVRPTTVWSWRRMWAQREARAHINHHGMHIATTLCWRASNSQGAPHLHRQVGHVGGARHTRLAQHVAHRVVTQAGRFGVRPLRVLLHDPQVCAAVLEHGTRIVHHASVHPGHGQDHADQQAQADPSEHKLAPGVQDVPASQADHG
jgi:hypothetical protein